MLVNEIASAPNMRVCFDTIDTLIYNDIKPAHTPDDAGKFWHHARVRNAIVNDWLEPYHTHVFWLDADIVDLPRDLPALLLSACHDGAAAPLVLIDDTEQFYDVYGFVENGKRARAIAPYFDQDDLVIDLDCVGCVYLIAAEHLRGNAYTSQKGDLFTEHMSIMQNVIDSGARVVCVTDQIAYHANLPKYGVSWH